MRYYLRKDGNGNVRKVYNPMTKRSVKAPTGCLIRAEIEENPCFWSSDIVGGRVQLCFYVEPVNKATEPYTVRKYCFYNLQKEYTYENGVLQKVKMFTPKTCELITTMERKTDEDAKAVVYEQTYPDRETTYRSTWRDGILVSKEQVSQYGTVLNQCLYVASKDGKAVIRYDKSYDFKAKRLVRNDEKRIDKSEFIKDNDEADVMQMYGDMYDNWDMTIR